MAVMEDTKDALDKFTNDFSKIGQKLSEQEATIAAYKEKYGELREEKDIWPKQFCTYDDVLEFMRGVDKYYTTSFGPVNDYHPCLGGWGNTIQSENRGRQLLAIIKVMNTADVLNGEVGYTPKSCNGWVLYYNNNKVGASDFYWHGADTVFKTEDLVKQAVEILGIETIKQSFGIFE